MARESLTRKKKWRHGWITPPRYKNNRAEAVNLTCYQKKRATDQEETEKKNLRRGTRTFGCGKKEKNGVRERKRNY